MIKIEEMGLSTTFFEQMAIKAGPVSVINKISVQPEEADELIRAWTNDFQIMSKQPGYISMQLYGGIGESGVYLNCSCMGVCREFKACL